MRLKDYVRNSPIYSGILFFALGVPVGVMLDVFYFFIIDALPLYSSVRQWLNAPLRIPEVLFINPLYENVMRPLGWPMEGKIILLNASFVLLGVLILMLCWLYLYLSGRR